MVKQKDPDSFQKSLLFEIDYPQIAMDFRKPKHRVMSSFEQRVEKPDAKY